MKKILAISLAFGLATLLTACGGGPKSVALEFYKDVDSGKIKEAVALMNPANVQMVGEAKLSAMLTEVQKKYASMGGLDHEDFSNEKEEGDSYKADVALYFKNGFKDTATAELHKIDGKWYIGK
jgi:hypothetical protein